MPTTDIITPQPQAGVRQPRFFQWTVTQFHNLCSHDVFRGHRVMLIHGVVWEQHHGVPNEMDPRPLRWTREQYHLAGELGYFNGLRVELVRGLVYIMSPKGWPHVVGCRKVADWLEQVFRGAGWVSRQEPIAAGDQEPEPDVAVLPGQFEDYSDHPTTALLIVEVADATLDYDTTTKAKQYATAQIQDYWVLDVDGRQLHVFRDPEQLPAGFGATAYRTHNTFGPADRVSPLAVPGASITVSDLLP